MHGGLLECEVSGSAKPGLLVSLRAVELHRARIDDLPDVLQVTAEKLLDAGDSWQYQFSIHHRNELLARGRAAVMMMSSSEDADVS